MYLEFWQYPIATPLWDEAQEGADAADWIQDFAKRWKGKRPILAAGGYAIPFPYKPNWPNLPYLIDHSLNASTKVAVKEYNGHIYAFSDAEATGLQGKMNHTRVVQDLAALPVQAWTMASHTSSARLGSTPQILRWTSSLVVLSILSIRHCAHYL